MLQGPIGIGLRGLKEVALVRQLDLAVGIDVQQPRQTEERGLQAGLRHDQPLLFILQLDVGAQSIDARADAVFLQVRGLIVKSLGQLAPRFGGSHVRRRPLAAQVLRHHQQHALLAHRDFIRPGGADASLGRAIPPP